LFDQAEFWSGECPKIIIEGERPLREDNHEDAISVRKAVSRVARGECDDVWGLDEELWLNRRSGRETTKGNPPIAGIHRRYHKYLHQGGEAGADR
jgi:hypothetical protein